MKIVASSVAAAFLLVFLWAPRADVADLETLGKFSISGGAEREEGAPAGGRGAIKLLGVVPLAQNFGLQGIGHYVGGRGSRYGLSAGPLFSWDSGKAGFFVDYQHRTLRDNNFVYIRPSVSLYFDQANFNLWYSHPVSSPQRSRMSVDYGISQLQGTLHYFPSTDIASFMRKDNLELTLGLQANTFGGAGRQDLDGAGVGPVLGIAFMPAQGVEVNLLRATIDNRSRYRVFSGIAFYFSKGKETLKELRRRYLEPNPDADGASGAIRRARAGAPPPPPPPST